MVIKGSSASTMTPSLNHIMLMSEPALITHVMSTGSPTKTAWDCGFSRMITGEGCVCVCVREREREREREKERGGEREVE